MSHQMQTIAFAALQRLSRIKFIEHSMQSALHEGRRHREGGDPRRQ
jgi:hypothetical protein